MNIEDWVLIVQQAQFTGDVSECDYCGVTGLLDEVSHAEDCPFVTGLWPVADFGDGGAYSTYICDNCECEHHVGFLCPNCQLPFGDDDVCRLVDSKTRLLVTYAIAPREGVGICTSCAQEQSEELMKMMRAGSS